jgi:hypothetical protein
LGSHKEARQDKKRQDEMCVREREREKDKQIKLKLGASEKYGE